MGYEVSHTLESQDRISIEVIPSVARWEGGATTRGVTTIILRINGVAFPHLGYLTLYVVHTYQLADDKQRDALIRVIELIKLRGDLSDAERQLIIRWALRIRKLPTMLEQDWFCDEAFVEKMGMNHTECDNNDV